MGIWFVVKYIIDHNYVNIRVETIDHFEFLILQIIYSYLTRKL